MTASSGRLSLAALAVMAGLAGFVTAPLTAQAVSNSAEFEAWRKVQKEDIDGLRGKFVALAKVIPASKLGWRPMEGTRSFHDVFAHVAAEGNTEPALPRIATTYTLNDLHEHLGQLVSYARMNQIVPPWSKKTG